MSSRMNKCNRGEDLVTYLYGEATSQDALAFEAHLVSCEMCREELSAFGPLRQQLKDWQIESSPRIEVSIQRSPFEVLRELISATPALGQTRRTCSSKCGCDPGFAYFCWNAHQLARRNCQLRHLGRGRTASPGCGHFAPVDAC